MEKCEHGVIVGGRCAVCHGSTSVSAVCLSGTLASCSCGGETKEDCCCTMGRKHDFWVYCDKCGKRTGDSETEIKAREQWAKIAAC